jgi:hypothetical protein
MTFIQGGSGTITSIGTAGLISGGTITASGTITTSVTTNKLVGRATAGTGVMEEIILGTGLSFSGTTLNASGGGAGSGEIIDLGDRMIGSEIFDLGQRV